MKELLILGAGTGGAVAANMLNHKLDLKEWRITIVDDIMTKSPVRISAEDTLQRALELMNKNRIKRLVITDENDRVQGVISRADLIKLYTMR
jgi:sulfide:quinone oxidoreductase